MNAIPQQLPSGRWALAWWSTVGQFVAWASDEHERRTGEGFVHGLDLQTLDSTTIGVRYFTTEDAAIEARDAWQRNGDEA